MYSSKDRMRAVQLYIKLGKRANATIRQLGYPTKNALKHWHREFVRGDDLSAGYVRTKQRYSDEQKRIGVEHYLDNGRCLAWTIKALGYPGREKLSAWIDEYQPGDRRPVMAVADAGSFSAGARISGLTRSAAGKAVARLEERLGVRLLNRTTRTLSLTDEGRSFHAHGLRVIEAVDQAEASLVSPTGVPRGVLRLSAPHAFGQRVIMPFIEKFLAKWSGTRTDSGLSPGRARSAGCQRMYH